MTIQEVIDIIENPFDGINGWISVDTFDEIVKPTPPKSWEALGYRYVKEAVATRGTIWVYLEKL